ncbi:Hsp20/alpha crystallin family protein [Pedobacter sp. N36a]|uniref:Hsp20/alpha crystallin family protein n=1 Tax=Pedobacter sp. N36a TaxID=2767996 RepID=UPI001656903A|nr:Hsp20/alpha crystallin family protein [Pedobacter sp. N36a]MBC8986611.1 Hsp20/alpha crystallin family protein [Pedobacter sp. N36a]
MSLVKFNNGAKNSGLMNDFNDVFGSIFTDALLPNHLITKMPAVNISETNDQYHIEMAVPGLKKEDFKVNLEGDVLTISAEVKKEDKQYKKQEFSYTSFLRSFTLPDSVDAASVNASYKDGVLVIDVAKKEEAKNAVRQIEIK